MLVVNRVFPACSRQDAFRIWVLADDHRGSAAFVREMMLDTIARVAADPMAYWLHLGDMFDAVNFTDKRFDPRTMDERLWRQVGTNWARYQDVVVDEAMQDYAPIMPKCLGILRGNHEDKMMRDLHNMRDLIGSMLALYGNKHPNAPAPWAAPLPSPTLLQLRFTRTEGHKRDKRGERAGCKVYRIYAHHGFGGAGTLTGKTGRLAAAAGWCPDADLFISGHFHDKLIRPIDVLRVVDAKVPYVRAERKHLILASSYARTYAPGTELYSAKRQYAPAVLCPVEIDLRPFGDRDTKDGRDVTRPEVTIRTN